MITAKLTLSLVHWISSVGELSWKRCKFIPENLGLHFYIKFAVTLLCSSSVPLFTLCCYILTGSSSSSMLASHRWINEKSETVFYCLPHFCIDLNLTHWLICILCCHNNIVFFILRPSKIISYLFCLNGSDTHMIKFYIWIAMCIVPLTLTWHWL